MDLERLNSRLFLWVRLLLGLQYLLGGINWWYKILPFPSLSDPPMIAGKHAVLVEMINTGWMFMFAKVIEVASGVLLLTNRFVPLILVIAFPVALMTFLLDAMILGDLFGWVMGTVSGDVLRARILDMVFFGGAVLAMHGYLMLGYLDRYLPMLALKVEPKLP